jgi:hypothetical protein
VATTRVPPLTARDARPVIRGAGWDRLELYSIRPRATRTRVSLIELNRLTWSGSTRSSP